MKILDKYVRGKSLDAGCGSGFFSKFFMDKNCRVFALDYSKESLKLTGSLDKKIKLIKGSVLKMPFDNETFDLVFSDGLLEHYKNPISIVSEFERVAKKNGIVATFVPNKISYWILIKWFKLKDIKEYRFTLKKLIELHERVGFKIIKSGGLSALPLKISPEFLAKYIGRIIYVIAKKV
ncbi:MAG: class I SAM-dependent methyltransferase [Methanosarcinales archaeon]